MPEDQSAQKPASKPNDTGTTGRKVVPLQASPLDRLPPEERARVLAVLRPFTPEARGLSGMARLNTLLSVPDPKRFVPELPTEELYFFLQDIGVEDCTELIRYASPEQVQGFVDLAAWRRDTFDLDQFRKWFDLFAHNGPDEVRRLLRSLDPELIVLTLLKTAQVYDAREAPEDVPDGRTLLPTPDGSFMLELDADDDSVPLAKAILDAIFAEGVEEGRKLVQAGRWELASELEEGCYRWRSARLEDLGFLPVEEALESEQDIDVEQLEHALRKGGTAGEPAYEPGQVHPMTGWFLADAHDAPFLAGLLRELPEGSARDRFLTGFTHLTNRRLSLRGLDLGEWETLEREAGHAFRMVSIGLERLVRGTRLDGPELLERLPLLAAYRVGRTLLARLRRRAVDVARRAGGATDATATPFDPPVDWWLDALRLAPPQRFAAPTAAALAPRQRPRDFFVPFRRLAEVDEADGLLCHAEAVLHFFEHRYAWGPDRFAEPDLARVPADERPGVTFSTLLLTGMANRILDRSADLRPLAAEDVRDLLEMLFVEAPDGGRRLDPRLKREAQEQLLTVSGKMKDAERDALFAFVAMALATFEETLRGLPAGETPDPRFLGDVLLLER